MFVLNPNGTLAAILLCGLLLSREAHAQFEITDIHNAARRMTSLTELMAETHQKLLDYWDSKEVFRFQNALQGEIVYGLPVFTDGLGSPAEPMDLLRAFCEAKILFGDLEPKDNGVSWSVALVAAGFAYGINRTFDVVGGDDGVDRGGGDSFGDQYMDAAYLAHVHVGPVRFGGGYLLSRSINLTVGQLASDATRTTTGEWITLELQAYGLAGQLRTSLLPGGAVDLFSFNAEILTALRLFAFEDELRYAAIPGLDVFLEYMQFQSLSVSGYDTDMTADRRGDDVVLGFKLEQSLWALFVEDWRRRKGDHNEDGGFEGGPLWLSAKVNYATKSHIIRDFELQLGFSTRDVEDIRTGRRVSEQPGFLYRLRVGYSIFSDPVALPVLLNDSAKDTVQGFAAEAGLSWPYFLLPGGVFDVDIRYRRNWAPDLVRVAEFVDTSIWYVGLGYSFAL